MLSTVYHKKASVLKIPLIPPLPKGDNKDDSHIFMRFLPTHLREDSLIKGVARTDVLTLLLLNPSGIKSSFSFSSTFFNPKSKSIFCSSSSLFKFFLYLLIPSLSLKRRNSTGEPSSYFSFLSSFPGPSLECREFRY